MDAYQEYLRLINFCYTIKIMSTFGGTTVLKSQRTRTRKARKESANAPRIALPNLASVERVEVPVVTERTQFNRFVAPAPTETVDNIAQIYGGAVDPRICGPADFGVIPQFGSRDGAMVSPMMCDPMGMDATPPHIYDGHTVPPPPAPDTIIVHTHDEEIEEGTEGIIHFGFDGGRGRAAYFEITWFHTESDALAQTNEITGAEAPTDVVIHTEATLQDPGHHDGTITFVGHDVDATHDLVGRVEIIDPPYIHGTSVDSDQTSVPETDDTIQGSTVPGIFGRSIYPGVYETPMIYPKPDIYGTPVPPVVSGHQHQGSTSNSTALSWNPS